MSSPDPSTRKRIGRGVPNFDYAVWDREKRNAVLASNYAEFMHAKFTPNSAMKHHPLSSGNKRVAEANPLGPDWGIGLRAGDPRDNDPRQWRGGNLLGEALSAISEAIRERETGLAHPASPRRFHTPTGNAGIHEISSAPQSWSLAAASACQYHPLEFSTISPDALADQCQEGLEIASGVGPGLTLSEHGPCLVGVL